MDSMRQFKRAMPPPDSMVLTIAEMATTYRISRKRIFDEMREGRLASKRVGHRVLIARADATAWWAALPNREVA